MSWPARISWGLFGIMMGLMAVFSFDMLFYSGRLVVDSIRDYAQAPPAGDCSPGFYAKTLTGHHPR